MRMLVLVEVEFDSREAGVDSLSDAQAVAHRIALDKLSKDEPRKVYYVVQDDF